MDLETMKNICQRPYPQNRQGIWSVIRTHRIISIKGICMSIGMPENTVRAFVKSLELACYLKEFYREKKPKRIYYKLIRDNGVLAPRIKKDGSPLDPLPEQKMWFAMKPLSRFTALDLGFSTRLGEDKADAYCQKLSDAGFLKIVHHDPKNNRNTYFVIPSKCKGPLSPTIFEDGTVYDQNTDSIAFTPETMEAANE